MRKTDINNFINAALQIEREKPVYKLGGNGSGGVCDCIGLIIGALGRCGIKWSGIHGSNWAARNECLRLRPIADSPMPGSIVFKSKKPGERGYALPARYGSSPDRLDYYHVGLVLQVNPPIILHCTGPGVIRDSKLGQWTWCAELKQVDYGTSENQNGSASMPPSSESERQGSYGDNAMAEPVLRPGAKGESVRRLQELLLAGGGLLPRYGADGKFGAETLAAVKAFQKRHGLQVDGICGSQTWNALKGGSN